MCIDISSQMLEVGTYWLLGVGSLLMFIFVDVDLNNLFSNFELNTKKGKFGTSTNNIFLSVSLSFFFFCLSLSPSLSGVWFSVGFTHLHSRTVISFQDMEIFPNWVMRTILKSLSKCDDNLMNCPRNVRISRKEHCNLSAFSSIRLKIPSIIIIITI